MELVGKPGREISPGTAVSQPFTSPAGSFDSGDGGTVRIYDTTADTLVRYFSRIDDRCAPKPLGYLPRLGIGVRMSIAAWPGVWRSMAASGYGANAIQNSLRELNLLEDLRAGRKQRENYLFSFGTIQEGHTGSTFEGLWTEGVLSSLQNGNSKSYGADADHIQIKRDDHDLERVDQVIRAARNYTFYTVDVSDILNYESLADIAHGREHLEKIEGSRDGKELTSFHFSRARSTGAGAVGSARVGGAAGDATQPGDDAAEGDATSPEDSTRDAKLYRIDENLLGAYIGKYRRALDALEDVCKKIGRFRDGAYDLELSIDETPAGVATCETTTTATELTFLLLEAERRGIPLTHIAPNFGVEKGTDYRCDDGIEGLKERLRRLHRIAAARGIMLDCHSGDDLSRRTRRAVGEVTAGNIHFKVSPSLQEIYARTLEEVEPESFATWWNVTREYAEKLASEGSTVAANSLGELEDRRGRSPAVPSSNDTFFHHYHFATVGLRNDDGSFALREFFYTRSPELYREYAARIERYLDETAADVLGADR